MRQGLGGASYSVRLLNGVTKRLNGQEKKKRSSGRKVTFCWGVFKKMGWCIQEEKNPWVHQGTGQKAREGTVRSKQKKKKKKKKRLKRTRAAEDYRQVGKSRAQGLSGLNWSSLHGKKKSPDSGEPPEKRAKGRRIKGGGGSGIIGHHHFVSREKLATLEKYFFAYSGPNVHRPKKRHFLHRTGCTKGRGGKRKIEIQKKNKEFGPPNGAGTQKQEPPWEKIWEGTTRTPGSQSSHFGPQGVKVYIPQINKTTVGGPWLRQVRQRSPGNQAHSPGGTKPS